MQQIRLPEWDDYYASKVSEDLPENDQEVFFKTESGNIVEGCYSEDTFDSGQADWDINDKAVEWHPIKVDM